jgi:hypothetical protein
MDQLVETVVGVLTIIGFLGTCIALGRRSHPEDVTLLLGEAFSVKSGRGPADRER